MDSPRAHISTIGKCMCGHSRAAHASSHFTGCGFCGCVRFQLDHVEQEIIPSWRRDVSRAGAPGG